MILIIISIITILLIIIFCIWLFYPIYISNLNKKRKDTDQENSYIDINKYNIIIIVKLQNFHQYLIFHHYMFHLLYLLIMKRIE